MSESIKGWLKAHSQADFTNPIMAVNIEIATWVHLPKIHKNKRHRRKVYEKRSDSEKSLKRRSKSNR